MFRVEDDRFEVDTIIETNRHCIGRLEVLMKELDSLQSETDYYFHFEKALTAFDKRAIRRLYAEYGLENVVMEMLKEIPRITIPLLISRMKQKEEEWIQEKVVLEKVIILSFYQHSIIRSFDHSIIRSFLKITLSFLKTTQSLNHLLIN